MLAAWFHAWGMIEDTAVAVPFPCPFMEVMRLENPKARVFLFSYLLVEAGCYKWRDEL